MAQAQKGDRVRIHFTGRLEDGAVFDSTTEMECDSDECASGDCTDDDCECGDHVPGPMELTIGAGDFFPQIEDALVGMAPGDLKTVCVPCGEAFGEYDREKVFTVPRSDMPADLVPDCGDHLVLSNEDDEELAVVVVDVRDDSVTFDANHPLAGEDLEFEIELLEILAS